MPKRVAVLIVIMVGAAMEYSRSHSKKEIKEDIKDAGKTILGIPLTILGWILLNSGIVVAVIIVLLLVG